MPANCLIAGMARSYRYPAISFTENAHPKGELHRRRKNQAPRRLRIEIQTVKYSFRICCSKRIRFAYSICQRIISGMRRWMFRIMFAGAQIDRA
jgi:hypothetical protein